MGLMLHPEHGVNPPITKCFYCGLVTALDGHFEMLCYQDECGEDYE